MNGDDAPLATVELDNLAERLDRPIALVGMMGVGKSSVGKRLAATLGRPFLDADEEIERSARMTIAEMFSSFGEAYFRDGERRVIARLVAEHDGRVVIATGGGAFCQPSTRELLLEKTVTVWLDSDLDTLVQRTQRKNNRPLLAEGDRRETLARLAAERREHYAAAAVHVVSADGPHDRTVALVLQGIRAWL